MTNKRTIKWDEVIASRSDPKAFLRLQRELQREAVETLRVQGVRVELCRD